MRIRTEEDEPIEIQMAPLIDCMFLLLIFFLVATTLKKMVRELPLELPYAEAAVEVAETPDIIVLGVDVEGNMYLNGNPATRTMIFEQLRAAAAAGDRVRLDADRGARYETVLEVVEICHIQGITNVGLHTRDPRKGR